jgi:hypothetical protein
MHSGSSAPQRWQPRPWLLGDDSLFLTRRKGGQPVFQIRIAFISAGFRIRIHFIWVRIRIQHFRLNTDPDPDLILDPGF